MIDYAAIADRAVEIIGSADESQHMIAFDVMRDETVSTQRAEFFESEIALMSRLGVQDADAILSKIEAAVPPRVQRMIQSDHGINLADSQTQALVGALVQGGVLTQAESDALFAPLTVTTKRWPDLLPGYVQDALRKRANGEV